MLKRMIKNFSLVLVLLLFMSSTAYGVGVKSQTNPFTVRDVDYTFEEYEKVLPFEIVEIEMKDLKILFNQIRVHFINNELEEADLKTKLFYSKILKYWVSKDTLKVILPFEDIFEDVEPVLDETQKKELQEAYKRILDLGASSLKEKDINKKEELMVEYFEAISSLYKQVYDSVAEAFDDAYGEMFHLELPSLTKDGKKGSLVKSLINYTFEEYANILPFELDKRDAETLDRLFNDIKELANREYTLKGTEKEKMTKQKKAKLKEFYTILQKYWLKEATRKLILPHEEYKEVHFNLFTRKQKVKLTKVFQRIEAARKDGKTKSYFESIKEYWELFGYYTQEQYEDLYDELALLGY